MLQLKTCLFGTSFFSFTKPHGIKNCNFNLSFLMRIELWFTLRIWEWIGTYPRLHLEHFVHVFLQMKLGLHCECTLLFANLVELYFAKQIWIKYKECYFVFYFKFVSCKITHFQLLFIRQPTCHTNSKVTL